MARVIVVGAGISGLACAHALAREGVDVRLLEASARAGGVIGTIEVDGFRFESGPNTIPAGARRFRELVGELELTDRLIASNPEAGVRWLLHQGKLVRLPHSPWSFLFTPLLSARGKRAVLTEPFRRFEALDGKVEPTLEAFLSERIGPEATSRLAGAFVRGIYASEIGELGAASAFPRIWHLAVEHGGIVRGMFASMRERASATSRAAPSAMERKAPRAGLLGFPSGLGELPDALARNLGPRLELRARARAIRRREKGWSVETDAGVLHECEALVLAVPAGVSHALLAPLLAGSFARDHLGGIGHAAVTLVHLGLQGTLPRGFGFLVPPEESRRRHGPALLGALFVSQIFPGRVPARVERAAAASLFYPTASVKVLGEPELLVHATSELEQATRSRLTLVASLVQRHEGVIPRYSPGHAQRMAEFERELASRAPNLWLAGSYVAGVSVEDCIARGRAVARAILAAKSSSVSVRP